MRHMIFITICLMFTGSSLGQNADSLKVGDMAPGFVMKPLDGGKNVFLRDYCGEELRQGNTQKHVVLLSFFASYCEPCKREIPVLHEVLDYFKDQPLKVFLVGFLPGEDDAVSRKMKSNAGIIQRRKEKARMFVEQGKYTLPVLMDIVGTTAKSYKITYNNHKFARLPHSFLIDKNGVIQAIHAGFGSSEEDKDAFKRNLITKVESLLR